MVFEVRNVLSARWGSSKAAASVWASATADSVRGRQRCRRRVFRKVIDESRMLGAEATRWARA